MPSAHDEASAKSVAIKGAQVADQIRDLVASWLMRDFQGTIVSVSTVTLSEDMRAATVWIRTYPMDKSVATLRLIRRKSSVYQKQLQRKLPRRNVPSLLFAIDTLPEDSERIDTLLK